MPIFLDAARDRINTIKVTFGDEEAEVTYYPNRMTPAMEDELTAGKSAAEFAAIMSRIIKRWQLVDEEGKELPADEETMAQVPSKLLLSIVNQINAYETAPDEGKASAST